ncbi:MAG: hypothetical protein GX282_02010 [Campylobacteraceae bacterium]|nr:hypothetical protein [Campylobacteraceae bacterium]
MKSGFSLIMGIFFIVIVATLGLMSLKFATQSARQSVDVYLREQAELYAMSATELTILAMQNKDYINENECLTHVHYSFGTDDEGNNPTFLATVNILYLDSALPDTVCGDASKIDTPSGYSATDPTGNKYDNVAILDVVVTSNPDLVTEPIRFHRRTVQRP